MKLESVRELKAELTDVVRTRVTSRLTARAARPDGSPPIAYEARRMETARTAPTLALGVAPARQAKNDYKLAVRLQRRSAASFVEAEAFRERARGEVDVRYVGAVRKRTWFTERHRPLQIGISVGHHRVTAGTLGAFVAASKGRIAILSNNHVLADENQGQRGDAIYQPGRIDGGRRPDEVATLLRFVTVRVGNASNTVDCAIAVVNDDVESMTDVLYRSRSRLGALAPEGAEFDLVEKWGRTTGHTRGRVSAFEVDNLVVGFDIGDVRFDGQIEIESLGRRPFSDGGDSGSLIVTEREHLAVALLFAGSQTGGRGNLGLTYANPIRSVLSSLKVHLLP